MIQSVHLGAYWYGIGTIAVGLAVIGVRELYLRRRRRQPKSLASLIQSSALNGFEKR